MLSYLKTAYLQKNGDTGYIRKILRKEDALNPGSYTTEVQIEFNGDGIIHTYGVDDMRSLDLAYCSTVHKAQGEEYGTVIVVLSTEHAAMMRRNLIYTAITRARTNVALIGEREALFMSVKDNRTEMRTSMLSQRIHALCA